MKSSNRIATAAALAVATLAALAGSELAAQDLHPSRRAARVDPMQALHVS